jgi:sigma-B regulation protein RsbU (phosphoserine phosphatase)
MHTRELTIQFFDGSKRKIPLQGPRLTLGRSSENDLAYPDDPVLSRRHLVFDFDGQNWSVEDLKTTNGTTVNGQKLVGRRRLDIGDTISAGRLTMNLEIPAEPDLGVTFVADGHRFPVEQHASISSDVIESVVRTPAISGTSRVQALLDAGREISGDRPLEELFQVILDLVVNSVGGSRGVIMIIEHGQLMPKAMRGTGFRISNAVRDRVMGDKESILILDASRHEVLSSSTTIQRQRVKSLMAVPLQTQDRVLGLVYVDSQDEMRFFLHEDLTLLTLMANMAAIRIEQTQLRIG